jgi:fructuronate reductase
MRYAMGVDEVGRAIDVQDPLAGELARVAQANGRDPDALVRGFASIGQVFGDDLPRDPRFTAPVARALARLLSEGAAATVQRFTPGTGPR